MTQKKTQITHTFLLEIQRRIDLDNQQQKLSCIDLPDNCKSVIQHDFLIDICHKHQCSAMLLGALSKDYIAGISLDKPIFRSYSNWSDEILNTFGRTAIIKGFKVLAANNFVSVFLPEFSLDRTIGYQLNPDIVESEYLDWAKGIQIEGLGRIYMVHLGDRIKIGYSADLDARLSSYKSKHEQFKVLFAGNRSIDISDEKQFHKVNNLGSEWYSLDREQELLAALTAFDREVAQ